MSSLSVSLRGSRRDGQLQQSHAFPLLALMSLHDGRKHHDTIQFAAAVACVAPVQWLTWTGSSRALRSECRCFNEKHHRQFGEIPSDRHRLQLDLKRTAASPQAAFSLQGYFFPTALEDRRVGLQCGCRPPINLTLTFNRGARVKDHCCVEGYRLLNRN